MKYLAASMAVAAAGAVYGLFGHGVFSYFMTYAFMIPLLGGALPHLIVAMRSADHVSEKDVNEAWGYAEKQERTRFVNVFDAGELQSAMIVTLTVGSLLKGVLDIYGTTNRLLIAYPAMAALIFAMSLAAGIRDGKIRGSVKNN